MAHHDYRIRMEKQQNPEVQEEYPNLTAPCYPTLVPFKMSKDLDKATQGQVESIIKKKLNGITRMEINTDYDVEKREKIVLIKDYDSEKPVYEKTIKMPEHLVD